MLTEILKSYVISGLDKQFQSITTITRAFKKAGHKALRITFVLSIFDIKVWNSDSQFPM